MASDIPEDIKFVSVEYGARWWDQWRRRCVSREEAAIKRAEWLDSGTTHSTWPVHFSEKRNPRKRKARSMDLHRLNRFEDLEWFEDPRSY